MSQRFLQRLDKLPLWIPTILLSMVISWLTLAPDPTPHLDVPMFPGADKLCHALMFGALAFTADFDWKHARRWQRLGLIRISLVALIVSLFGVATELLQRILDMGRSFEAGDIIADIFGTIAISAVWILIEPMLDIHN